MTTTDTRYSCQGCTRTDLTLTANGKVRSHAANGKRASESNPHCGMGSEWPVESTTFHTHRFEYADDENGHSGSFCTIGDCEMEEPAGVPGLKVGRDPVTGDAVVIDPAAVPAPPNPFRDPLPGGMHDNIARSDGRTLEQQAEIDRRRADPMGHARKVIGADPADGTTQKVVTVIVDPDTGSMSSVTRHEPVDQFSHAERLRTGRAGGLDIDPGAEAAAAYVNSQLGREAVVDRAHQSGPVGPVVSAADAFLDDGDAPDDDGQNSGPRYFPSRYDGSCSNCGSHFDAGDEIRSDGSGRWEGRDCCEPSATPNPATPRAVARTLPVRNGRYVFPHPVTGKQTSGTRASKFAEGIADSYMLDLWRGRMITIGMALKPELIDKAKSAIADFASQPHLAAKARRDALNAIADAAKLAAGSKNRAAKGTQLHKYIEELGGGTRVLADVPDDYRTDAGVYLTALEEAGFRPVRNLIERSVFTDELGVVGTFDGVLECVRDTNVVDLDGRKVQIHAGEFVIGDVKSGDNIKNPWLEILIQLAIYAHAVNENGVAVCDDGNWRWSSLAEQGVPKVRNDVGIVMHVPYGSGECKLYFADLITGWRGAKICQQNREFWKIELPKQPVMSLLMAEDVTDVPEPVAAAEADPGADCKSCGKWTYNDTERCDACTEEAKGFSVPTAANTGKQKSVKAALVEDLIKANEEKSRSAPVAELIVDQANVMDLPPEDDRHLSNGAWPERFRHVTTRAEGSALWREAKDAGVPADELKRLVALVQLTPQAPVSRPPEPTPAPAVQERLVGQQAPAQLPAEPSWADRAAAVRTNAEASKVFQAARANLDAVGGKGGLAELVEIMKTAVAKTG